MEVERDWLYFDKVKREKMYARVFDVEVSVRDPNDYSAFVPENKLAYTGLAVAKTPYYPGNTTTSMHRWDDETEACLPASMGFSTADKIAITKEASFLVGHNLKYDLHWAMRVGMVDKGRMSSPKTHVGAYTIHDIPNVWDTQLVEYLLTGQQARMISLDNLCIARGLPVKPPTVKTLWEAGVLTKDIPSATIRDYLHHDLMSTKAVFEQQWDEVMARPHAFQFLVQSQLNMLRMVTLMEWNGLCLDTAKCLDFGVELTKELDSLDIAKAASHVIRYPKEARDTINWTSNNTVSSLIFGGSIPYSYKVPNGTTKAGKPKFKTMKDTLVVEDRDSMTRCFYTAALDDISPVGKSGHRSVDEDTLKVALSCLKDDWKGTKAYIEAILEYRGKQKLLTTYVEKLPTFLKSPANSLIHHDLNQCIAATGRLTSSNPNMQNRPEEVAKLFKSRHKDGMVVSIDFSQIEVYALAQMCGDRTLIDDLNRGSDIHWETAVQVYPSWVGKTKADVPHRPYRDIKSVNFGLLYGGSVGTVAKQTGVDRDIVAKTKKALYNRYPGIAAWQDRNIEHVERNSRVLPHSYHVGGFPKHFGTLRSETGRVYFFTDEIAPDWVKARTGADTSFSPTQIKNYPIQGTATGDWVPLLISDMWNFVFKAQADKFVPINTTHDDIEIDIDLSVLDSIKDVTDPKTIHEDVCTAIEQQVNAYVKEQFPELWYEWTGTKLLVTPRVNVKEVSK